MQEIEILTLQTALAWAACKCLTVMPNTKPWNVPKVVCESVTAFLIYQKQGQWNGNAKKKQQGMWTSLPGGANYIFAWEACNLIFSNMKLPHCSVYVRNKLDIF